MSTEQETKSYVLHYWYGRPGRGEFVRLAFEYMNTPYSDTKDNSLLLSNITEVSKYGTPPHFAPPCLELPNGKFISQTPAILGYLIPKLDLDGTQGLTDEEDKAIARAHVMQLICSVLDLNDEVHDTHHPVDLAAYYEEQRPEASRRSKIFRAARLPKFFNHFQAVLESNKENKGYSGPYLLSSVTTMADLALFHMISGLEFAFPRRLKTLKDSGKYDLVFKLYERVKAEPSIDAYMKSSRRQGFSNGIFRYYPELDAEE